MFTGKLWDFQQECSDRMVERGKLLVAMDMGTGKTPTTIHAIETLIDAGEVGGGLIVAPASLKYQWKRQINKFTDGANVIVVDGTPDQRKRQYIRIKNGETEYAIINYEQVLNDWRWVRDLPRDFVVGDEIQAIKGFQAKRSMRMKMLQANILYGLSGQPLENRPEDVYSIMQWIDDQVLGRFDLFDKTFIVRNSFGKVQRYKNLPTLNGRLMTAMVRRTRDEPEVAAQMPKVSEQTVLVDFDKPGATLYRKITRQLLADLADVRSGGFNVFEHYNGGGGSRAENEKRGKIMAKLTCLRMLCDNPELLHISADHYEDLESKLGSQYAAILKRNGDLDALKTSPKLKETIDLVGTILEENPRNKVVLFSFFKPNLRIIQVAMQGMTGSVLFTGDLNAKRKDTVKQQFEKDPNTRLFLSSDAGGAGLDLPNANFLISYDLPWSAGKMDQRNSRIIRLSSEFTNVTLINILMRGSIEERQYNMLEEKRAIASAVVDGKGIDSQGRLVLGLGTLKEFLEDATV